MILPKKIVYPTLLLVAALLLMAAATNGMARHAVAAICAALGSCSSSP